MLIVARAVQGAFGALLATASCSVVDDLSRAQREGQGLSSTALSRLRRAVGLLLGGALTQWASCVGASSSISSSRGIALVGWLFLVHAGRSDDDHALTYWHVLGARGCFLLCRVSATPYVELGSSGTGSRSRRRCHSRGRSSGPNAAVTSAASPAHPGESYARVWFAHRALSDVHGIYAVFLLLAYYLEDTLVLALADRIRLISRWSSPSPCRPVRQRAASRTHWPASTGATGMALGPWAWCVHSGDALFGLLRSRIARLVVLD